jgi:predicted Rossmann fold flavoprotein
VLDLSRFLTDYLPNNENPIAIYVDLIPGANESELDKQIRERIAENPKKTVAGILAFFLPKRAATILCRQCRQAWPSPFNFDTGLLGSELKKDVRKKIVRILKALPLSVVSTRPLNEAIVTRGGVSIEQVQSKTMESKICPGLFFAGEVLDVDGPCGGYNLQMCWSTGALAGCCAAKDL